VATTTKLGMKVDKPEASPLLRAYTSASNCAGIYDTKNESPTPLT